MIRLRSRWIACCLALLPAAGAFAAGGDPGAQLLTNGVPADMARFYAKLFGWEARAEGEGGRATVALLRGERVMATVRHHSEGDATKVRARWLAVFGVADPAASAGKLVAAGARPLEEKDAPAEAKEAEIAAGAPRFLLDPEGAPFGLVATPAPEAAPGGVWPVLLSPRPPEAAEFYRAALGGDLKPESRTPLFAGDFLLMAGGTPRASVSLQPTGGRGGWVVLVAVADIEATTRRARADGARVLRAPGIDLIGGRVAVLSDPAGGVFGLYEAIPLGGKKAAAGSADIEVEALSK